MQKRLRPRLFMIVLFCLPAGCSSLQPCYGPDTPVSSLRTIHVVRRGWHTGIIIAAAAGATRTGELDLLDRCPACPGSVLRSRIIMSARSPEQLMQMLQYRPPAPLSAFVDQFWYLRDHAVDCKRRSCTAASIACVA
jgi:hypothetical protein